MPSRIVELSSIIAENTRLVDDYFSQHGIPTPSFDIDGPTNVAIPHEEEAVSRAYVSVLDATTELNLLLTGPTETIMRTSATSCISLQAIYRYDIARKLPVGQAWPFPQLSEATGLNVVDLRRILRHAMCNGIFCEPKAGIVAHTAGSRLLAESELVHDFVGVIMDEKFAGAARVVDALEKYNGAHAPGQTGFALAHDTDKGLYEEVSKYPKRHKRWAAAMEQFAAAHPLEPLISGYPWADLGNATFVDVGGAWGPVAIGLAQKFPDLKFVVQDQAHVVEDGPSHVPQELRERILFETYDIITEKQPRHGADIYYFRNIFHNWPDEYCIRILQNQIPALKPGARIIINDICAAEPDTLPLTDERKRRSMDLGMLTFFGSREHTAVEWAQLLKEADPRFQVRGLAKPAGDTYYILDVEWKG